MKNSWYWLLGAVLLLIVLKKKGSSTTGTSGAAGALPNTNTAGATPDPWLSTANKDVAAVQGTYKSVSDAISGTGSFLNSVFGLFGGSSKSTGTASPTTSGSGAGVVNNSSAGDNDGSGSPPDTSSGQDLQAVGGYDQWGASDWGAL